MSSQTTLTVPVALVQGEAPAAFQIFKQGANETTRGTFMFTQAGAALCMRAAEAYGNHYAIDYGHSTLVSNHSNPAEAQKAAGWFVPQLKDGEMWATNVQWTPTAKAMGEAKAYRCISPAFKHSKNGEIEEFINVALTNTPAGKNLQPLLASRDAEDGTQASSTHAAFQSATRSHLTVALAMQVGATDEEIMQEAGEALQRLMHLTHRDSIPEAFTTIHAWQEGAAQAQALSSRIALLESERRRGWQPGVADAEQLRLAYEDAINWLKDIAKGLASPSGIAQSATPSSLDGTAQGAAYVTSLQPRGW